jgi:hypothetical protein
MAHCLHPAVGNAPFTTRQGPGRRAPAPSPGRRRVAPGPRPRRICASRPASSPHGRPGVPAPTVTPVSGPRPPWRPAPGGRWRLYPCKRASKGAIAPGGTNPRVSRQSWPRPGGDGVRQASSAGRAGRLPRTSAASATRSVAGAPLRAATSGRGQAPEGSVGGRRSALRWHWGGPSWPSGPRRRGPILFTSVAPTT